MTISTKPETGRPSRLTATRRSVLIGGGTLVAAQAVAGVQKPLSEHYVLRFVDDALRDTVELVEVARCPEPPREGKAEPSSANCTPSPVRLRWRRRDFGPRSSFRIGHQHLQHQSQGASPDAQSSERLPLRWGLTIDSASFPGKENRLFQIVVTFERPDVTAPWTVAVTIGPWWTRASQLSSAAVKLNDFILSADGSGKGEALIVPVPAAQTEGLLKSLFGLRIQADTAVNLSIDRDFGWSILSAYKANSPNDIARKLYILDIPLEFGELKLRRLRSDQGWRDDARFAASGAAKAGQPGAGETGAAAQIRPLPLLFDAELPAMNAGRKEGVTDGLHGEVRGIVGFTGENKAGRRVVLSSFDLAARADKGWSLVAALDLDLASGSMPRLVAALQHQGDPSRAIAGCELSIGQSRPIGRLWLRDGLAGKSEGPFDVSVLRFTRQLVQKRVLSRFSLEPASKEHAFRSSLGSLIVSALPASAGKPGQALRRPGIEIEAFDESDKQRRVLSDFRARLALHSAAIDVPERLEPAPVAGKSGAPQGPKLTSAAVPDTLQTPEPNLVAVPGTHASRLEFNEAEVLMLVPALSDKPPALAALGAADVVIPLGPAPSPPLARRARDFSAGVSAAEFHLDRARLTLLRPSDLLSLKFRFADLVLTVPWPPQKGRAAFLAPAGERRTCRAPAAGSAPSSVPARDERPMLVVEFPPQHVAERAYFRQLKLPPDLPRLTADPSKKDAFDEALQILRRPKQWRQRDGSGASARRLLGLAARPAGVPQASTSAADRLKARLALRQSAIGWPDASVAERPAASPKDDWNTGFDNRFFTTTKDARLPKEQRIFVGAEFLDPDARRIAIDILRAMEEAKARNERAGASEPDAPDVEIDPQARNAILARYQKTEALPPLDVLWPDKPEHYTQFAEAIAEIERAKDRRDADYAYFRLSFAAKAKLNPPGAGQQEAGEYRGKNWFGGVKSKLNPELVKFVGEWRKLQDDGEEKFEEVTEARLSGPSRIAFRINCDDFEPERAGGRIPFSVEGLTNWGGMDMAVVRRAERLMQAPSWQGTQGGRLLARWQRRASLDDAEILRFQGLSSSDHSTRAADREHRGWIKDAQPKAPRTSRLSSAQRLAEVHASANRAPDPFETALELPFRLFLSPAQDATWKTPSAGIWRDLVQLGGACQGEGSGQAMRELWTARLLGDGEAGGVRAVWSPDFRPEALLSTDEPAAPPRGPFAPWAIPRSAGIRSGSGDILGIPRFRTGLDAYDRHELVALSSVHGLPVLGRRQASGAIDPQGSQLDPPPGFWLSDIEPDKVGGKNVDLSAIYRPKPLTVSELSLSALGGNLDVDTAFVPPASARRKRGSTVENLFDALSIERWRQRTVLGRDVVVEVVYKGFLFPIGHRASLVKLTERRFEAVTPNGPPVAVLTQRMFLRIGEPEKTFPAHGQPNRGRRFPSDKVTILTRRTPDLVDPTDTKQEQVFGNASAHTEPNGRIWLSNLPQDKGDPRNGTGLCFWPRTAKRRGAEVWFEMRMGTEAVAVKLPLIFVDNTAANDPATMAGLAEYYNDLVPNSAGVSPTRRLGRLGQPVVMAPERKPGDTSYETDWWIIKAEGREARSFTVADNGARTLDNRLFTRDSFMEGLDQPPFYPFVERANCRLVQVERFTGQQGPLWGEVFFDGDYVAHGFGDEPDLLAGGGGQKSKDNLSGIYLGVHSKSLDLKFGAKGDQAGAMVRPEMNIIGISGTLGPLSTKTEQVAGTPLQAVPPLEDNSRADLPNQAKDQFKEAKLKPKEETTEDYARDVPAKRPSGDPKEVFPASAKLLGIVELKQVVKIATETARLFDNYPVLKEAVDYGSATLKEAGGEVRTVLVDTVITPAIEAADRLDAAWDEIAQRELNLNGQDLSLGKAYPQLGVDLDSLRKALREAADSTRADTDFFASLSLIHEAGRRLVRTIERIGRDPLAAMSGAQLAALRDLRNKAEDIRDAVKTIANLDYLPKLILDEIKEAAAASVKERLVVAVVALAPKDDRAAVEAVARQAAKEVVDAAIMDDLDAKARLKALPTEFAAKLKEVIEKKGADGKEVEFEIEGDKKRPLTPDEKKRVARIAALLESVASDTEAALRLLLSDELEPVLSAYADGRDLIRELKGASKDHVANFARISKMSVPALRLLGRVGAGEAAKAAFAKAAGVCDALMAGLRDAIGLLLPVAAVVDQSRKDFAKLAGEIRQSQGLSGEPKARLEGPLVATEKALLDLHEVLAALELLTATPPGACELPKKEVAFLLRAAVQFHKAVLSDFARIGTEVEAVLPGLLDELGNTAKREAAQKLLSLVADATGRLVPLTLLSRTNVQIGAGCGTLASGLKAVAADIENPFGGTAAALRDIAGQVEKLPKALEGQPQAIGAAVKTLADRARNLPTTAQAELKDAVRKELAQARQFIDEISNTVLAEIEERLARVGLELLDLARATFTTIFAKLISLIGAGAQAPFKLLAGLYADLQKLRDTINASVKAAGEGNLLIRRLLAVIRTQFGLPEQYGLLDVPWPGPQGPSELLRREKELVDAVVGSLAGDPARAVLHLDELVGIWRDKPALARLFERFGAVDATFLKVVVVEALDLRGFRREIETLIRELVPSKQTLSYDLSTEMNAIGGIFLPESQTRLEIATRTVVDLLRPLRTPEIKVAAHMGPFGIQLFGSFHVVTINFSGLDFTSGTGQPTKFDVRFTNVVIGPQAEYLKQLQSFLSPSGDGPYVKLLSDKPGLEAGYGVNLGCFGVGALSFSNVTLNAAARLPFSDSEAEFVVSIGRSDAPFLISSTIFGGGGYLALIANAKGFIGLECSFDYGGVATLGFGPLSGTLQITFGVYLRAQRGSQPEVGVNFMARGAVHIACFGFSTSLMVRLTYRGGQMQGVATYTFSFSLGFDDIEFRVDVYCNQGARMGTKDASGAEQQAPPPAEQRVLLGDGTMRFAGILPAAEYAALGPATPSAPLCQCKNGGPAICVDGPRQSQDWLGYAGYFDPKLTNESFC